MDSKDVEQREGAKSQMSEGEVAVLRREIKDLSDKADRQHRDNQRSQEADRETFRATMAKQQETFALAMTEQRNAFQEAINKQFLEHVALDKKVERTTLMLEGCMGDGQPGEGRLGRVEEGLELMKKFRWQALSVVSLLMWVSEMWIHSHGGK